MEDWLAAMGLGHFARALRERGCSLGDLAGLTEPDLLSLGLSRGEARRFMQTAQLLAEPMADRVHSVAERRPLSMMFVDLVGSSRLAEVLPPEDLWELLRRYGDFCAGPIGRYGGRVTRMVGDGILAFFCYPIANQNDPERAVRAGLEIAQAVGEVAVPGGERLAVRIGIATGRVVVGDLHTAGGVHRSTVIGSVPNLAARLQSLAPPGGVVVAEETYRRVHDRFVCADLGSYEFRGMAQPHRCWQVLREVAVYGRVRLPKPGVLVGREAELSVLDGAWQRAMQGQGGVVVVSGEPGIGKSHLVETFLAGSAAQAVTAPATVLLEGADFENESPLRPVLAWLHRTAAAAAPDAEAAPASQLAVALPGWAAHAASLVPLLDPEVPKPPGTPEQVRESRLAALEGLLLAQAADRPLRLVVEDLHWFDPTTRELVERLAQKLADARVLMVLTTRHDFDADGRIARALPPGRLRRLALAGLDGRDVEALAAQMLPDNVVPEAWLPTIRKAGGVPLFVGEMVRELAVRGERPDGALADTIIPASLQELLAGRLDRLGEAKEVAQAASVIGPDLRQDVLARVCAAAFGTGPTALEAAIDALVQAGVLTERGGAHRASAFTHALLREAAENSLLRERRQALHGHTADALLACDPDVAIRRPELIAQHLEAAARASEAAPYWSQAGKLSLGASALREAIHHLERSLAALDTLAPTADVVERKLEVMALLGTALMEVKGFGSPEAARLYAAAIQLCNEMPESRHTFPLYWGWWRVTSDNATRQNRALTMLERARQRRDPEMMLQAYHCSWASDFFVGSYAQSCQHAESGLAIYDEHDFRHHAHTYGDHDAKVCAHGELALCSWIMGKPLTAREQDRLSFDWAETLDHLGSRLHNRYFRLCRHAWSGDLRLLADEARQVLQVAEDKGMEDLRAKGMIFLGYAGARGLDPAAGRAMLEEGWRRQCDIGTNEDFPVYVTMLAEALIGGGEPERARAALRQAEVAFDASSLWFWRSEVRRMEAEAVLAAGSGGAARAQAAHLFDAAIDIAEQQGAAMLALRAATGLARLDPGAAGLARLRRHLQAVAEDDGGPDMAAAFRLLYGGAPERRAAGD